MEAGSSGAGLEDKCLKATGHVIVERIDCVGHQG